MEITKAVFSTTSKWPYTLNIITAIKTNCYILNKYPIIETGLYKCIIPHERHGKGDINYQLPTSLYCVLVEIPLDEVKESWLNEWGPLHKRALAEHYGIYRDLFSDAFFVPVVDMTVLYDYDDEFVTPVHSGNTILPSEVCTVVFLLCIISCLSFVSVKLFKVCFSKAF